MSTIIERENDMTARPARTAALSLKRRISAGEVEQRVRRGHSKAVAVEVKRRASPIQTGRTPNPTSSEADRLAAAGSIRANPAGSEALARPAIDRSRLSTTERSARTLAVERAWKEEQARQVELEAERERLAEAAAKEQAEELRI